MLRLNNISPFIWIIICLFKLLAYQNVFAQSQSESNPNLFVPSYSIREP